MVIRLVFGKQSSALDLSDLGVVSVVALVLANTFSFTSFLAMFDKSELRAIDDVKEVGVAGVLVVGIEDDRLNCGNIELDVERTGAELGVLRVGVEVEEESFFKAEILLGSDIFRDIELLGVMRAFEEENGG